MIRLADHASADVRGPHCAVCRLGRRAARARLRAHAESDPVPAGLQAVARCAGARGRSDRALAVAALDDASPRSGAERWWASWASAMTRPASLGRLAASPSPADRAWSARVAARPHPESSAFSRP